MNDSHNWSVDRIAASNLLVALGIKADDEQVSRVAAHFAQHRVAAYQWIAERIQGNALQQLESASMRLFRRHDDSWVAGFEAAEQVVMGIEPNQLIDVPFGDAPSKGRVLRSMVREVRERRT